jgi:hypothetical protein
MLILNDPWTDKDTVNLCLGIMLSILIPVIYEGLRNRRAKNKDKKELSFLESPQAYLWQHYDIANGSITRPIQSYMHLRYLDDKRFKMTWFGSNKEPIGEGFITWQDSVHGQMSAHEYPSSSYRYRNVFYREIKHLGKPYDAIFVNADDEGTKYVMLRSTIHRSL